MTSGLRGADIRAKFDHPVIDADGHVVEVAPVYEEYVAKVAGPDLRDEIMETIKRSTGHWYELTDAERFEGHVPRPAFWVHPAKNTGDLATAILPNLTRARMDEIGVDVSIVYPTFGLVVPRIPNGDVRRAACRPSISCTRNCSAITPTA